ncbi:MAG: hypothetical protein K2I74_05475, partial [Treponemataceae bacterium]|nr:hypothetical protein [Treponemataceae bacterium]
ASDYARALLHDKQLEKAVMHGGSADDPHHAHYIEKMPRTWRLFHTEYDNLSSLTAGSWDLLARILDTLGATQFLA